MSQPVAQQSASSSQAPRAERSTVPAPIERAPFAQQSLVATEERDDRSSWDEAAFRAWWSHRRAFYEAYWARRRWAREAPALARLYRARASWLEATLGTGALVGAPLAGVHMSDCGPFDCGPNFSISTSAPVSASSQPASVRRQGDRWNLANQHVALTVFASRGCEISYVLPGSVSSSIRFDTPRASDEAREDEPSSELSCEVREAPFAPGAGLELSWRAAGWTQRALLTLTHRATLAEATLARTVDDDEGAHTIELVNLSPLPRAWSLGGRDLSVDPGGRVRVRVSGVER